MRSIEWLESELASLDAAIVLVAHDRWFLEAVATAVLELEDGRSTFFPGSWHVWREEKAARALNAAKVADVEKFARDNGVDLRAIELDVGSQESVDTAIAKIVAEQGRLDVVIHNAGHMVFGPAEAFTPEQLAELYDINVLSTQRVNRAALPQLRKQGKGLLVWVSASCVPRVAHPPSASTQTAANATATCLIR